MNSAKLKETIANIVKEESDYQEFFRKALEKAGKSITDMSDEEKKEFFNKIDAAWDGKGEKNEELVGNQKKLDVDGDGEIEASDLAALRAGETKEESVTESTINESPSSEEIRIAMLAVNKQKKYRRVTTSAAVNDLMNSLEVIARDIKNGKIKDESVNEGKKRFNTNYGVGKSKYVVNYHDGVKKHKDGSDFFDVQIFKNQKDLEAFKKALLQKGFVAESVESLDEKLPNDFATVPNDSRVSGMMKHLQHHVDVIGKNVKTGKGVYKKDLMKMANIIKALQMYESKSVNEAAGKEAMGIAAFTGTRGDAVQKFIDDNKLDAKKLFNYVKGGKLTDRLNFVTAIVGTPGNSVQKRMIKMFGESVTEGVSPKDMESIKGAVQSASSFMNIGSELKKLGMKYIFATSPMPIYVVQDKGGNRVGIVNKKYATKPDFVHGDTAVGVMESLTEGRAFINAARKAKSEGKTEFEFNGKTYPVTIKESVVNEDANMNKKVKALLDKELRDLRKGGSNHYFAVMAILMGALIDANFHSEAKKVPSLFGSKAKYEGDPMAKQDLIRIYEDMGEKIAHICKWDGKDIVNAVGFYVSMTIGRPMGQKIENLV